MVQEIAIDINYYKLLISNMRGFGVLGFWGLDFRVQGSGF